MPRCALSVMMLAKPSHRFSAQPYPWGVMRDAAHCACIWFWANFSFLAAGSRRTAQIIALLRENSSV